MKFKGRLLALVLTSCLAWLVALTYLMVDSNRRELEFQELITHHIKDGDTKKQNQNNSDNNKLQRPENEHNFIHETIKGQRQEVKQEQNGNEDDITRNKPTARVQIHHVVKRKIKGEDLNRTISSGRRPSKFIDKSKWPPLPRPGELGYGGSGYQIDVRRLSPQQKAQLDKETRKWQLHRPAADTVPLRRRIMHYMEECSNLSFDYQKLPTAGVVLIFNNELLSVLLRTVYSILDASPPELLTEVVLVDDASTEDFLGKPLEDYIKIFGERVKLVRMGKRAGLIQSRMAGFDHVTGDVAVFLDAHCEVNVGWLEPLVHRIQQDDRVIAVPATDTIRWDDSSYRFTANKDQQKGGMDWDLIFNWKDKSPVDGLVRKSHADPIRTAQHLGCCFATSKNNFERLGRYDPGLQIWGCENTELSFKAWMCHGSMEIIPCSHVGHMFRKLLPFSFTKDFGTTITRNCLRVAAVWMDSYQTIYQDRIGQDLVKSIGDIGDLSDRHTLRKNLQCNDFSWYLKNIYQDLYVPLNVSATGPISSMYRKDLCLSRDLHGFSMKKKVELTKCIKKDHKNQWFMLTKENQIRRDSGCLDFDRRVSLIAVECNAPRSQWKYNEKNQLVHVSTKRCLNISKDGRRLNVNPCKDRDRYRWSWKRKN